MHAEQHAAAATAAAIPAAPAARKTFVRFGLPMPHNNAIAAKVAAAVVACPEGNDDPENSGEPVNVGTAPVDEHLREVGDERCPPTTTTRNHTMTSRRVRE